MAEEENEIVEPKKKGMSPTVKWIALISVAVVILAVAGFAGWKFYDIRTSDSKKEKTVSTAAIWSAGTLIVNLMDDKGERYLKVVIQIEASSQDCMEELEKLRPKVTDGILVLLASKSYGEIANLEGKQRIRDEIAMRLNGYLVRGQVRKVYFTEFLIQ